MAENNEPKQVEFEEFREGHIDFPDLVSYKNEIVIVSTNRTAEEKVNQKMIPIRLDAFSIVLVKKGELSITIDYVPYVVRKNMFFVLIERHVINDISASEDFDGIHIVAQHDFMHTVTGDVKPPIGSGFNPRLAPVFELEEGEFDLLLKNVERLKSNIQREDHAFQSNIVKNETGNLIFEIWNFAQKKSSQQTVKQEQQPYEEITSHFFNLLFQHSKKEREVSFYSNLLCVTPVYLLRAVKRATGKTATEIIGNIVLTEAKILLRKPNVSIQEIAEELNFSDQASFSKFFKKHTGESPMEYKKKLKS